MFTSYTPNHRVIVKDIKTGEPLPIGVNGDGDISADVINLTTNKAYGRAAGTFQLILTYREWPGEGGYNVTYSDVILPDCILTIELDPGDGSGLQPVMLGLVDRTSRTFNAAGGAPQRNVKVCGQDAGKLLLKSDMGWDVAGVQVQIKGQGETAGTESVVASYMKRLALQSNTASGMCMELLNMFRATIVDASPTFLWADKTDDDWWVWDADMQYISNTSVWDAMKGKEHAPWNTLTTETISISSFEVRLERTPINGEGRLTTETTHEITDDHIIQEDLGYSDGERINLLCYWPTLYKYSTNDVIDVVLADTNLTNFDEESIKQHGYCRHIIYDNFLPVGGKTAYDVIKNQEPFLDAADRALVFWEWYRRNHEYKSGNVALHGRPDIRCGHGLVVKQAGGAKMEYLIEQVSHQYATWPVPSFVTSLQVTRGQLRTQV